MRTLLLTVALACNRTTPTAGTEQDGPFYDGSPTIEEATWDCDVEAAEWSFEVRTIGWTGGGKLWMAKDLENLESHSIKSKEAAADGSWDHLSLSLDVESDPRDAASGSSTRYRCSEEAELTFLLWVDVPRGDEEADCLTWGLNPTLWEASETISSCDQILSQADTGDTGASE
jgi:hypothetical protein